MVGIRIDVGDLADLPDQIKRGIVKGMQKAPSNHDWESKVQSFIDEHFNRLEDGGSMSAIGGEIVWPIARHGATMREREKVRGRHERFAPLLQLTGSMRRDYTTGNLTLNRVMQDRLSGTYTTPSTESREKARKHHRGGLSEAVFQNLSPGGVEGAGPLKLMIQFPRREFLFWTKQEANTLVNDLKTSIETQLTQELGG